MRIDNSRYELVAKLGNGVQAECWKVIDHDYPELDLAAKIWHTRFSARADRAFEERNKRLDQEARLLGAIHQTYTVMPHSRIRTMEPIDDVEHIILGVTMELAGEGSLDAFIKRNPQLPMPDRVKLLEQLAWALEDLQVKEIIHNDIKPANILIMNSGHHRVAKLGDFGLAFRKGQPPVGGGTVMYMAPELIDHYDRPSLNVTPNEKTDIYSLGIVFYQILLGIHPYIDLIENGAGGKVLHGYFATHDTIDFGLASEAIDPALVEVIQAMCSRDPDKRPTMSEVSEDIASVALKVHGRASLQFLSEYPKSINTFRWTDEVHRAFNEHEQLAFLRGNEMDRDPEFLASALLAHRLHGFSIHRLLGSRDYLLRIWRRDADKLTLNKVLEAYEADRNWAVEIHDPVLRWPGLKSKTRLPLGRPRELLDMIRALVEAPDDDLLVREAVKVGLIHGRSKTARAKSKGRRRRAIRAVCRVSFPKSMQLERAQVLGEHVYLKALRSEGVREVELFANPGMHGAGAEFVLIVELDHFHSYRPLLEEIEKTLSNILSDGSSRPRLRFRSHFEPDEQARYESYDGRIFYELYRRDRSRRAGHGTEELV